MSPASVTPAPQRLELLWSPRSPFVRKVVWAAAAINRLNDITLTPCLVATGLPDPQVMRVNPLNKIPTMILHNWNSTSQVLLGSHAICAWMDRELAPGQLLPACPVARDQVQFVETLADGALNILIFLREEHAKPPTQRYGPHIEAMKLKLDATLARLEALASEGLSKDPNVGSLSLASCLNYLEFRFTDFRWQDKHEALASWHAGVRRMPCIADHPFVDDQSG